MLPVKLRFDRQAPDQGPAFRPQSPQPAIRLQPPQGAIPPGYGREPMELRAESLSNPRSRRHEAATHPSVANGVDRPRYAHSNHSTPRPPLGEPHPLKKLAQMFKKDMYTRTFFGILYKTSCILIHFLSGAARFLEVPSRPQFQKPCRARYLPHAISVFFKPPEPLSWGESTQKRKITHQWQQ